MQQYSKFQLTSLVVMRMLIGWHFLYEGLVKLFNPGWSAQGYLMGSQGIFSGLFKALAADSTVLSVIDFLNVWGLIFVGLTLILGYGVRWGTIAGMVLLGLYYLAYPPFGATYGVPAEGSYLIVNKNLIEIGALWVLKEFPTSLEVGLAGLFKAQRQIKATTSS